MQPAISAAMSFLIGCGRLNIHAEHSEKLFELVGPPVRSALDMSRLTTLAQLAAKLGFSAHGELAAIWHSVHSCLEMPAKDGALRGYASQVAYGQLLLALIFDDSACATRDRALVVAVGAVHAAFSVAPRALDERLARQLQVAELSCRVERPSALESMKDKGLLDFIAGLDNAGSPSTPLTKVSSQQHLQVSGTLSELSVYHDLEEDVAPYVADVRVSRQPQLIEIDGPLHFVGQTSRYDLKSSLKHRLLTKQGWRVHHIAWFDWPANFHSRVQYMSRMLRSSAPDRYLHEYSSLQERVAIPKAISGVGTSVRSLPQVES